LITVCNSRAIDNFYLVISTDSIKFKLFCIFCKCPSLQGCGVGGKMSDLFEISDSDSLSEWSLTVNNFVATSTQWKSWYTARILCFKKNFHKLYHFTSNSHRCVMQKMIQLDFRRRRWTKNPTPTPTLTPTIVSNPTPTKTSDPLRPRNPASLV